MVFEGEKAPSVEGPLAQAVQVFRMLANGMGGIDWSGLEVAVEKYEVQNLDDLIDHLLAIKAWKKPDGTATGRE